MAYRQQYWADRHGAETKSPRPRSHRDRL